MNNMLKVQPSERTGAQRFKGHNRNKWLIMRIRSQRYVAKGEEARPY